VQIRRIRLIGIGLLAVLSLGVAASLYTLSHPQPPAWLALALLPGMLANLALSGGVVHDVEMDTTVFLNIAAWALLLGAPGIFCLTVDRQ
jgi:hypothetical protein